jgi:hypothetical protein
VVAAGVFDELNVIVPQSIVVVGSAAVGSMPAGLKLLGVYVNAVNGGAAQTFETQLFVVQSAAVPQPLPCGHF